MVVRDMVESKYIVVRDEAENIQPFLQQVSTVMRDRRIKGEREGEKKKKKM
jgi:hypothetical protein